MSLEEEVKEIKAKAVERMFEKEKLKEDISKIVSQIEEYMSEKFLEKVAIKHFGKNSLYCSKHLIERGMFEMNGSNIMPKNDSILNKKISILKSCMEGLGETVNDILKYTEYLEVGRVNNDFILGTVYLKKKLEPYLQKAGYNVRIKDGYCIEVRIALSKEDVGKWHV